VHLLIFLASRIHKVFYDRKVLKTLIKKLITVTDMINICLTTQSPHNCTDTQVQDLTLISLISVSSQSGNILCKHTVYLLTINQ